MDIIDTGATRRDITGYGQQYRNISIQPNTLYYFLNDTKATYVFLYIVPYQEKEASVMIVSLRQKNKQQIKKEYNKLTRHNTYIKQIIKNAEPEKRNLWIRFIQQP
ncbi:MAG: hypothetical protein QXS02_03215 [Candidatus Thermoplasmatota archaeon]